MLANCASMTALLLFIVLFLSLNNLIQMNFVSFRIGPALGLLRPWNLALFFLLSL